MSDGILNMEEGAIYDRKKNETRFGVFSEHAEKVELCLFDERGKETRVPMEKDPETNVWKANLKGIKPGQKYGYRAYGEYNPDNGMYFNPNKLLVDPYAYEIEKSFEWDESLRVENDMDSAPHVPKCVVADMDSLLSAPKVPSPNIPQQELFIYEAHVKGLTALNPAVPQSDRGTFKGMAHKSVIDHFKNLGINAVEILPTQAASVSPHLGEKGMTNYWGYNTVTYNATDPKFGNLKDLKEMVDAYHKAGIKVIMDVVYNHTGEGGEKDSTLSMRGLDNPAYYRTCPGHPGWADDASGCGNALDLNKPKGFQVTEKSLELLADLGVDGFRFDLAAANARNEAGYFDKNTAFMRLPIDNEKFKDTLFIAEPWAATGGWAQANLYQIEGFSKAEKWLHWAGNKRDDIRKFTCGKGDLAGVIAYYMARRGPDDPSVTFAACHDGFTLHDFFKYGGKRNEANGENNRDGDNEPGANFGDNPGHIARCMANTFATLILSGGIPMLSMGDEFARTQNGNNNAYCQDNEISYMKWEPLSDEYRDLPKLIGTLAKLRKEHPALGDKSYTDETVSWMRSDGQAMNQGDWASSSFSFHVKGNDNEDLMVIMNLDGNRKEWQLPEAPNGNPWKVVCSTSHIGLEPDKYDVNGNTYGVDGCEVVILRSPKELERTMEKDRPKTLVKRPRGGNYR